MFLMPQTLKPPWGHLGSPGLPDASQMLPRCLPDASRCLPDASSSPLTCDVSQVPLSKSCFDLRFFIKKHQKNDVDILGKLMPKWTPKGYPYLEEFDKDRSGITKNRGLQHAYKKMRKEAQFHVLKSLIFMF